MKGATVMLGGPIQHLHHIGKDFREFEGLLNTLVARLEGEGARVFSAHRVECFGLDTGFDPEYVTKRDLDWMRQSDVFVALLPSTGGAPLRTDGTHVELGWASALGRPVILVLDKAVGGAYTHLVKGLDAVSRVVSIDYKDALHDPGLVLDAAAQALGAHVMRGDMEEDQGLSAA